MTRFSEAEVESRMTSDCVSPDNLAEWFDAGAVCVGMGSKLIKKDLVCNQQFEQLAEHIEKKLSQIQVIKNKG